MRKLIVLVTALVAFAVPTTAQAVNYASTPWTAAGNAGRDDGTGGIISCQNIAQINSLNVFQIRGASYVSCNTGPGGSDWRSSFNTLLYGEIYDLFTVQANEGISGGVNIGSCGHPSGWLCKGETWTANEDGSTPDPYWWHAGHFTIQSPSAWQWVYAAAGCSISDSPLGGHHELLSCNLNSPQVTHH